MSTYTSTFIILWFWTREQLKLCVNKSDFAICHPYNQIYHERCQFTSTSYWMWLACFRRKFWKVSVPTFRVGHYKARAIAKVIEEMACCKISNLTHLHYHLLMLNTWMVEFCANNILSLQICHPYSRIYLERCKISLMSYQIRLDCLRQKFWKDFRFDL